MEIKRNIFFSVILMLSLIILLMERILLIINTNSYSKQYVSSNKLVNSDYYHFMDSGTANSTVELNDAKPQEENKLNAVFEIEKKNVVDSEHSGRIMERKNVSNTYTSGDIVEDESNSITIVNAKSLHARSKSSPIPMLTDTEKRNLLREREAAKNRLHAQTNGQMRNKLQKFIKAHNWKSPQSGSVLDLHYSSDTDMHGFHHAINNHSGHARIDGSQSVYSTTKPHLGELLHQYHAVRNPHSVVKETSKKQLLCSNQSVCHQPSLQLDTVLKIYFCKHPVRFGVRFYYLVREGLLLHPNVQLYDELNVDILDEIDYVIYLPGSAPWHKTECNATEYSDKLIVLDEFDFHVPFKPPMITMQTHLDKLQKQGKLVVDGDRPISPNGTVASYVHKGQRYLPSNYWYFTYFKRSFVKRQNGVFQGYPHIDSPNIYPITYSLAEAYIGHTFKPHQDRGIELLCTLRGHKKMPTRQRVQDTIAAYVADNKIANAVTAQVTKDSRTTVSTSYFDQMRDAEIIVTVNPAYWEGDFRLWEALATGALIFCDYLHVPHPYPLINHHHIVFFNNQNMSELVFLLDFYRKHKVIAREIAMNGYLYAMKHHRTVNMVDYILTTTRAKTLAEQAGVISTSKELVSKEGVPLQDKKVYQYITGQPIAGPGSAAFRSAVHYNYTGQYLNTKCHELLHSVILRYQTIGDFKISDCE